MTNPTPLDPLGDGSFRGPDERLTPEQHADFLRIADKALMASTAPAGEIYESVTDDMVRRAHAVIREAGHPAVTGNIVRAALEAALLQSPADR